MRSHGVPQFTVDAHRPVRAFDVLGVSFATELGYTNLLTALDLAGIPLAAAERGPDDPLVLAGGHAAFNPEPIAEFLDGAVLGDGEQAVLAITELIRDWKRAGRPGGRDGLLLRLAADGGVYVPRFYDVDYRPDGRIGRVVPNRPGVPRAVAKHTVMDLDSWPYPRKPLVPVAESVHERFSVEIFRGCTRGCRFCQAGMITRPVRERTVTTDRRHGRRGPGRQRLQRGGAAVAVQRRPQRDQRDRDRPGGPLRGHEHRPVAAVHQGRRVQRDARRRAEPQRAPLRPHVRARGRHRPDPQGDQQDGHRGGPDQDRHHGVRQRVAAGEALLHVRAADRDRRGRGRHRPGGPPGDRGGPCGHRAAGHPLHGVDRRLRAQAAHPVPVGGPVRSRDRGRPAARARRTRCAPTAPTASRSGSGTTTAGRRSSRACCPAATAGSRR